MVGQIRAFHANNPVRRSQEVGQWLAQIGKFLQELRNAGMKVTSTLDGYAIYGHWASDGQPVTMDEFLIRDPTTARRHMAKVLEDLQLDIADWNSGVEFNTRAVQAEQ